MALHWPSWSRRKANHPDPDPDPDRGNQMGATEAETDRETETETEGKPKNKNIDLKICSNHLVLVTLVPRFKMRRRPFSGLV